MRGNELERGRERREFDEKGGRLHVRRREGGEVHCIPQKSVIIIAVQIGLITAPKRGGENTTLPSLTSVFLAQYGLDGDNALIETGTVKTNCNSPR